MGSGWDCGLLAAIGLAVALAPGAAAAAAPSGTPNNQEVEALSPAEEVDLVPSALSKVGMRVYAEETISVLADFGAADASEFRSTLGLRVGGPLSESFALRLRAIGDVSVFDFDGDRDALAADLGGIDLFERLYDAKVGLGAAYQLTKHWSLFTEGRANLGWEDGASIADAVTGSGAFGIGFQFEPQFEVALGVDVGSRMDEGGVGVSPVVSFRWRIRDDMRLESLGLGLLFAVDLLPNLELQLRGSYEGDRYRLDDDEGLLPDQTLRQRQAPVLVALRWTPRKHLRIIGGAGSLVYQEWKVEADDDGGSNSIDAGPAALLWLRVEYRF